MTQTPHRRNPPSRHARHLGKVERALRAALVRPPRHAPPEQKHARSMALLKAIGGFALLLENLVEEMDRAEEVATAMPDHPEGVAARRRVREIHAMLLAADQELRGVLS